MSRHPYRELLLYSEKIDADAIRDFFLRIIKSKISLLEFIDLSWLFSLGFSLLIRRHHNTVKLYLRTRLKEDSASLIMFPFKLSDPLPDIRPKGGIPLPIPYVIGSQNMFLFMTKGDIEEINIRVFRFLGRLFAFGTITPERGFKKFVFILDPAKFMEIDLQKYSTFYMEILEPMPKYMYLHSELPLFESGKVKIGLENFDVFAHGLVVGTSGSGKSKFLEVLVRAVRKQYGNNCRIVLIDPHGEFSKTFKGAKIIDYKSSYIDPLDVGQEESPLVAQLITQLLMSILGRKNKYAERVLFYSVHLLLPIGKLSLQNINLLLTDASARAEFVSQTEDEEVKRFFDNEYPDIYMHSFNEAVLPIINFIGEYLLHMKKGMKSYKLLDLMEEYPLVVISFDPHFFGKSMIKFLSGGIMNQMYILAITEKIKKKTLFIVDEFPVVETPVAKEILAETRKFNLFIYIAAQYLSQISQTILDSMVTNVKNVIAFKVNRDDAAILTSMIEIKLEEFFKKKISQSEIEEAKKEMFVNLHPRECIVRLFDGSKFIIPMKVKTVDVEFWRKIDTGVGVREAELKSKYGIEEKAEATSKVEGKKPKEEFETRFKDD